MSGDTAAAGALTRTLEGVYAAVYVYGLVGAHVSGDQLALARSSLDEYLRTQQWLMDQLTNLEQPIPVAAPAYVPQRPVTTSDSARDTAARVDNDMSGLWSALAAASTPAPRLYCLEQAQSCAERAIRWGAPVQAFPGGGVWRD